MSPAGSRLRLSRFDQAMLGPIIVVAALAFFFPPDGTERAEWLQFIGRFHVLAVHLPIALILLVPVFELAGRNARFSHLRQSASFILALAILGAIGSAFLGWCLGRSGNYSGSIVIQHMWAGILLAAACWICWILRKNQSGSYTASLVVCVALVTFTGYRGGQLSLGPDHLTARMPASLRRVFGVSDADGSQTRPDPNTFYGARIHPILAANCVSCHGADKHKADLRLDSYKALMRGGKDGAVILAGNAAGSDLLRRLMLPASSDDFMPKGGKPALNADQIKLIELWIASGASDTLAVNAIKDAPAISNTPGAAEVKFEEIDSGAVGQARAEMAPTVAKLQEQYPNTLDYESRGSADLRLNASLLGAKFGDSDLEAFAPLAGHITELDLSRTAITNQSATVLATMKRLQTLRLASTNLGDAAVLKFGSLDQLESLNLFGTGITSAGLPAIAKLPKLKHIYVGETKVGSTASLPDGLQTKVIF